MRLCHNCIFIFLLMFLYGCGEPSFKKSNEDSAAESVRLLARAEFVAIKDDIVHPPFSSEILQMVPEGSYASSGMEIARLSAGSRAFYLKQEQADLDVVRARLELEKKKLELAESIEKCNLKLAQLEFERARLDLEKVKRSRDWLRLVELEESLKLDRVRLNLLKRQVEASTRMVGRGFAANQELLQNEKDLALAEVSASLTQRLIPFVENHPDERKLQQAVEAFEKGRQALNVASYSYLRNLAEYRFRCNEEQRNLDQIMHGIRRVQNQVASLSIIAPGNGLVLYGNSYSGSELIKVQVGSQVYPGVPMLRIVDPKRCGIGFDLDPKEFDLVRTGTKVWFRPDSFPETLVSCQIETIAPMALEIRGGRPDGRTMINVKAIAQEPDAKLKLGYSGSIFLPEMCQRLRGLFKGNRRHKLVLQPFSRRVSTTGDVKPASSSYVLSTTESKLNFLEEEGKTISSGTVVARLDTAEISQNHSDNEISLRKLKEELDLLVEKNKVDESQLNVQLEVKAGALEVARLKHAALLKSRDEDKIIDLRKSLELVDAKIALAKEKIEHVRVLRQKGLRSEIEQLQAENEVAALLKERAITVYKLDYEDSGPASRTIALSELEVEKARTEFEKVSREVELGRFTGQMSIKIKEAEVRKIESSLEESRFKLDSAEIVAQADGVVIHNETHRASGGLGKAKVGDQVYARVPFMQIAAMNNLQVHTEVSEMDVKFIKPGDEVKILLKGASISTFPGWVASINHVAKTDFKVRQDATVSVIIDLVAKKHGVDNVPPGFRPGQSCEIEFLLYQQENALVLPYDAVLPTATGPCAVSPAKELQPVEILFSDGLHGYALKSGLSEGAEVLLMEAEHD